MKTKLLNAILPLVFILTLVSCSNDSSDDLAPATDAAVVVDYAYSPDETALADLINEYRVSQGLNPLQTINHISYKAEEHDNYMIANKVVNHDQFEERSRNIMQVLGAVKVNENVAYNYSTPHSVLTAWLASPGHKANIEGDFTHFGISIRVSAEGKKYYTNIFMKK